MQNLVFGRKRRSEHEDKEMVQGVLYTSSRKIPEHRSHNVCGAYNKKEAIEECRRNDKSRFHTFNCMALLDDHDKCEDKYEEKYIAWAKQNGVYEEVRA